MNSISLCSYSGCGEGFIVAVIHFHLLAKGIIILTWVLIVVAQQDRLTLAAGCCDFFTALTYIHVCTLHMGMMLAGAGD